MSKIINLAIIGTGMAWERLHYPALKELQDKYNIVAFANPTIEKAKKAADMIGLSYDNIYTNYKEMLEREDVDAVDVLVPIELNYSVSKDVILSKKHLICEKPLGKNLEEAEDFVQLSAKHNTLIMIAENYRYSEENNIIKSIIEEKRIGDILYFIKNNMSNFEEDMLGNTFAAKEWRQHPHFIGGAFLDGGVHDIASLRYIFGNISKVSAFAKEQSEDYCPYSHINCNLYFESGTIGHYTYCPTSREFQSPKVGLRIYGTEGSIYLEEKGCGVINLFYDNNQHEVINYTPEKGFYNEFVDFYNAFVGIDTVHVTPSIEFGDVAVIMNILKSVKKEKTVKIGKEYQYISQSLVEKD
jgi:predicted dehydrogenase